MMSDNVERLEIFGSYRALKTMFVIARLRK